MNKINKMYLDDESINQIKSQFDQSEIKNLELKDFLVSIPECSIETSEDVRHGYHSYHSAPAVLENIWSDKRLISWLEKITSQSLKYSKSLHQSYTPGSYTLLHEEEESPERLLIKYDFTDSWNIEWGGFDIVKLPDSEPIIGPREKNSLFIYYLAKGDLSCVRYLNHLAGDNRVDLDVAYYDII